MRRSGIDEVVGFFRRDPAHAAFWLLWPFNLPMFAKAALRCELQYGRDRRVYLAVQGRWCASRVKHLRCSIDRRLINTHERKCAEVIDKRLQVPALSTGLHVHYSGFEEVRGCLAAEDGRLDDLIFS